MIDVSGRETLEQEDHQHSRWWSVDDLRIPSARFYPKSLPKHITALLANEGIDERTEDCEQ